MSKYNYKHYNKTAHIKHNFIFFQNKTKINDTIKLYMRTSQNRQLVTFINYCKQSKIKPHYYQNIASFKQNHYTVQHNK